MRKRETPDINASTTTPPTTNTSLAQIEQTDDLEAATSVRKERRVEPGAKADIDETPTSSSAESISLNRRRVLPLPRPRTSKVSPIKTVDNLEQL